jgi:hypothetical protein
MLTHVASSLLCRTHNDVLYLPEGLSSKRYALNSALWTRLIRCSRYSSTCPEVIQSDNALKVRFSATLGQEEPEVELALVQRLCARAPLTEARRGRVLEVSPRRRGA